ncbi:hypothetical protein G9P44_002868 [Scheffersomyces stipitis]|nr:hypothetical protein G9P44_002868 [Scheffersomyces stipitis]
MLKMMSEFCEYSLANSLSPQSFIKYSKWHDNACDETFEYYREVSNQPKTLRIIRFDYDNYYISHIDLYTIVEASLIVDNQIETYPRNASGRHDFALYAKSKFGQILTPRSLNAFDLWMEHRSEEFRNCYNCFEVQLSFYGEALKFVHFKRVSQEHIYLDCEHDQERWFYNTQEQFYLRRKKNADKEKEFLHRLVQRFISSL